MHTAQWINLLRRIPPEVHPQLMLVTNSGTEIAINALLMVEGECLGIKGRLAGSQDTGRVFFIPYSHIDYLGFQRAVSEEEFRTYFGEGGSALRTRSGESRVDIPLFATEPTTASPSVETPPATSTSSRTPLPSRSALLESIKARGVPGRTPPPTTTGT